VVTKTKWPVPVYEPEIDGNVFDWLISTAEHVRRLRQIERYKELEEATTKPKSLDATEVADQERQAIDAGAKGNGRKVSSRSRHQVLVSV
jgi:hypothetical protein